MKKSLILLALLASACPAFSQLYNLTVQNGYAEINQALAGDTIHIWAEEWGAARTFNGWSGDTAFLERPGEWHTRIIMPAHDVTVKSNTRVLPTGANPYFSFEQIKGKNILKPVYYYFPAAAAPKAVVWLWHGTGGSAKNWVWKDFEMVQYCKYLIANGLAVIVTESDESTLNTDLDGDGNLRYDYSPDSVDNYDVANVRAIRDTFIHRGKMSWETAQAAAGFSAGGAFSVTLASFLGWSAAITYNNPGSGYVQYTKTPVLFSMALRDMHPDVGPAGNQQAYDNYQYLLGKGQCAQFFMLRPSPTYAERFKRLPGVTTTQAYALHNELVANGCFGLGSYLVKSPNEIENMVLNNPQNWPNIVALSDTLRGWVKDELAVMWSSHHFHHEYMAADVKFILEQCAGIVATPEPGTEPAWQVFPNPAGEQIRLPENAGRARVFDVQGQIVLDRRPAEAADLDVSGLPPGFYFLEILQENAVRRTGRFVKI